VGQQKLNNCCWIAPGDARRAPAGARCPGSDATIGAMLAAGSKPGGPSTRTDKDCGELPESLADDLFAELHAIGADRDLAGRASPASSIERLPQELQRSRGSWPETDPKRRFRLVRRCEDFLGEVDAAFVDEETPGPPTSGRVLRCGRPQNEQRRASPSSLRLRHGWRARPGSPRLAASTNTFLPPVPTTRIRSTSSRTHTSDQPFRSTSQPK